MFYIYHIYNLYIFINNLLPSSKHFSLKILCHPSPFSLHCPHSVPERLKHIFKVGKILLIRSTSNLYRSHPIWIFFIPKRRWDDINNLIMSHLVTIFKVKITDKKMTLRTQNDRIQTHILLSKKFNTANWAIILCVHVRATNIYIRAHILKI